MILSEVSVKRPVFTTMVTLAMLIFGMICYNMLGVNLFPEVDMPIVTIRTIQKGASPETIEQKVTDRIEEAVNTISGIKEIKSTSLENVSIVIVEFELGVDVDSAATDVRDKVAGIRSSLPDDIDAPVIEKVDLNAAAVVSIALSTNMPMREATKLAKDSVRDELQKISGVGSVKVVGGLERQVRVWLKNEKLAEYSLTADDVVRALKSENLEVPGGKIEEGRRDVMVRVKGEVEKIGEFAEMYVAYRNGYPIKLGDVARIEDGAEERKSVARIDGRDAVVLEVRKQSGSNTVIVADAVKAAIERINKGLPAGTKAVVVSDTSKYIKVSIEEVFFHLIYGGGLAVFIVFVFLRSWRTTLISAVALPTSVIGTFAFMKYMNFTFNNLTMLGLTISIGMLIDDAIVVIENIHRHSTEGGKSMTDAARIGTDEIGLAVLATTFSIVAVFVPVAFMKGIIGKFFYEFGMTVTVAVLISLLVSFTMTPMLCSRFMKAHESENAIGRAIEWCLRLIERAYRAIVGTCLKMRFAVLAGAALSLYAAFVIAPLLKSEFIPKEDRDQFIVTVETPTGSSLSHTASVVEDFEKKLSGDPEVTSVFTAIGADAQEKQNFANILVSLKPKVERPKRSQFSIMSAFRESFAKAEGCLVSVQGTSDVGSSGGKNSEIQFVVSGPDLAKLGEYSNNIMKFMASKKGFVDIDTSFKDGKPESRVIVDRARASKMMVPIAYVATTIRTLIGGEKVTTFRDGKDEFDVFVRLESDERNTSRSMGGIFIRSLSGQMVDFDNIARIEQGRGPTQVDRSARQRKVTVSANLDGLATSDAMGELERYAKQMAMPAGYSFKFDGNSSMMKESFESIFFALALAVVLVYMILASQFESFIHPLTIMLSLPLSVVGALGALWLLGKTISVFSLIGMIMLMGLVTKNAILLIDYALQLVSGGIAVAEAIAIAGERRLRPILMTTAAMIFGMLPIALGTGAGAETRGPMAVCVIGGLLTSTALTLVVVPVVFTLADDAMAFVTGSKKRAGSAPEGEEPGGGGTPEGKLAEAAAN